MANAILTLTDSAGMQCSSELPWETYALLVGMAQRAAQPDSRSTPSNVAVAALEQTILRRIDHSEGMHASLLEDALRILEFVRTRMLISETLEGEIKQVFTRALASGIPLPSPNRSANESPLRWRVSGVVSYTINDDLFGTQMVIDTVVTAPDWHAAENAALNESRAALGLDPSVESNYSWMVGPAVTPLQD